MIYQNTLKLILLMLAFHSPLIAKKYYKHVDENGITHYSDKPPQETEDFESYQIRVEDSEYEVKIVNRGTKQQPIFYAINPYHGPIALHMKVTSSTNTIVKPRWPKTYVVPGNSDIHLATVEAKSKYQAWSFQYSYSSTLGDPEAKHNDEFPYQIPFRSNKKQRITQGFNGKFSHFGEQSKHAIDIDLDEGTPILAARGGVVMDIAEDFYSGGIQNKKLSRGNYVRILHDDGSMAVYAHLMLESVIVRKGQRVSTGQHIAASGNTGYSSGPHLHFAIQINQNMRLVSVPFLLQYKNGRAQTPVVGAL